MLGGGLRDSNFYDREISIIFADFFRLSEFESKIQIVLKSSWSYSHRVYPLSLDWKKPKKTSCVYLQYPPQIKPRPNLLDVTVVTTILSDKNKLILDDPWQMWTRPLSTVTT